MAYTSNFQFYDILALEELDLTPNSILGIHLSQLLNLVNFSGLVQGDCCSQPSIDDQIKYEICLILQLLTATLPDNKLNYVLKARKSIFIFKFIAILIQYYSIVQGDCIKGAFIKKLILSLFAYNNGLITEITNYVLNNIDDFFETFETL